MQRLKVNRHRPCLYRHYYLAVGFIVDKPCQTEVFQPIFCSYTGWTTKSIIQEIPTCLKFTNVVPTYTIFSLLMNAKMLNVTEQEIIH